ncbi:MAG: hypothetical protein NTY88_07090 [Bacteroidetes bacterium]|nr:hypothetical protein [Bacteroidota bacterium]
MAAKEIFLTAFYLVLFNALIFRFRIFQFKNFKPLVTHVLFNLKFVVGIFIWFIYSFYYKDVQNNDVHKFYNDALILRNTASENPQAFFQMLIGKEDETTLPFTSQMKNWERNFDEAPVNENKTLIRLNALLMFISFKTYFVHILFMCFISLLGFVLIANSIFGFTDVKNSILAIPVLFLPSILFWTSGVMKEPVLISGLGLFIYGITNWGTRNSILALIIGSMLILITKFFVLACLLPATIAYLLFRKNENPSFVLLKYVLVNLVLLLLAFNVRYIVPQINLQQMLINKQTHSIKEAEYFKAGSRIEIPELKDDPLNILKTSAVGIWNTITRPYIWETKNMMMLASAAENVFIVPFLLMCFAFRNRKQNASLNLFLFLLTVSLAYFAIVGICTPVLGNLVRYKTPLLVLFMFAFIIQINSKYIPERLNFLLRKN